EALVVFPQDSINIDDQLGAYQLIRLPVCGVRQLHFNRPDPSDPPPMFIRCVCTPIVLQSFTPNLTTGTTSKASSSCQDHYSVGHIGIRGCATRTLHLPHWLLCRLCHIR